MSTPDSTDPETHPCADLPVSRRIDLVLAVLSAMDVQEEGGWSVRDMAELCGCDPSTIQKLIRRAKTRAALELLDRDVVPRWMHRRLAPELRGRAEGRQQAS